MRWFVVVALAVPAHALAWPADDAWIDLTRSGAAVSEPSGDATPTAVDLAGDSTDALAAWSADPTSLYLRLRLAGAPAPGPALTNDSWGVLLDVGGDGTADAALFAQGSGGAVTLYTTSGDPGTQGADPLASAVAVGDLADGAARLVEPGDGALWLDLAVPLQDLADTLGITAADPLWVLPAADGGLLLDGLDEIGGCDGTAAPCPDLAAAALGPVVVDGDADGLTLPLELLAYTDPQDADTDDDGVLDGADEGPHSCDTDGDGLVDGLELGFDGVLHPDTDPAAGCVADDADLASTTDPTDVDSDDGGLPDGLEDRNGNGRVDPLETDPNDPTDDLDSDGDTLPDVIEGTDDFDGDGIPAFLDLDSDGDGVPDRRDGLGDVDGDEQPAYLDPDSDGDGLGDGLEGSADADGDGLPNHEDTDADGDGLLDVDEGADDVDGDEIPNFLDLDSDGDFADDADEGLGDEDCDGAPDAYDPVFDDGFCDTSLAPGTVDTAPFDGGLQPVSPPEPARFTGGACSGVGGVGGAPLGLLALGGLLGLRRRRTGLVVATAVAAGTATGRAQAQEANAQRLRPATDGWAFTITEDAAFQPVGYLGAEVLMHHARAALVTRSGDERVDLLGAVTTMSVLTSITPSSWFRFGAEFPIHLSPRGDDLDARAALGDLRFSAKVRLLPPDVAPGIQLAALADLEMPTGARWAWLGAGRTLGQLGVALRADPHERVVLGTEVGVRTGAGERLGPLHVGPQLTWGAAVSAVAVPDRFWASLEADGAWSMRDGATTGAAPVELLGTLRARVQGPVVVTLGGGGGVTRGVGAPAWRVMGGIAWRPGYVAPSAEAAARAAEADRVARTGELVVRVQGPAAEALQGAEIRIEGLDGVYTADAEGRWRSRIAPGRYILTVSFSGRTPSLREVEVTRQGLTDLTVVLMDEPRPVLGRPVLEGAPPEDAPPAPSAGEAP